MQDLSQASRRMLSPEATDTCRKQLYVLLKSISGIESVLLCSTDGFELTSVHKDTSLNGGKLAAVSSSILALVEAFLGEIKLTGCQSITLEAANGKALISAIPAPHHPMLLVVITNNEALLGRVLHGIRLIVQRMIEIDQHYGASV